MTKQQIEQLQEKLRKYYAQLNRGGCGLFAYAFVSRIGGQGLRLAYGKRSESVANGVIDKHLSSEHFVVEYEGMVFDGHNFGVLEGDSVVIDGDTLMISDKRNKDKLLLAVFEGGWNPTFYKSKVGNNNGDVLRTFLSDFESLLDLIGVKYSSRIS